MQAYYDNTIEISIFIGLILGLVYIYRSIRKGLKPEMSKFIAILLASIALIASVMLGVKIIFSSSEYMGELDGDKEYILLGSISVIYLSIKSIVESLHFKVEEIIDKYKIRTSPSDNSEN